MIHLRKDERQMIQHTAHLMQDKIWVDPDQWDEADQRAVDHLEHIGKAETSALVLTGAEMTAPDARSLMGQIVQAELAHWVPNASQRLIYRAAKALEVPVNQVLTDRPDCGAEPSWHALSPDWIAGQYVLRCVTCGRLYRHQ